ncbi:uncharacterized protein LOC143299517 [Babylonia areolata]|uniref:uncharacterized protein LOC143299517 n=1 Tax=Babylonia areolata TaxID=304850 RepID=UPI003FD32B79
MFALGTVNLDVAENRVVRGDAEDDYAEDGNPPKWTMPQDTWKSVMNILTMPVSDCCQRSHPRVVPDYSLLVLMSCVTNPVLGALACWLHRTAKNLSYKGQTRQADVLYLAMMAVSLVSIGSTVMATSLLVSYHVIQGFSRDNVLRAKPQGDCFFREQDDKRRKELNLTRNDYCRLKEFLRNRPLPPPFTNSSKVIDKTKTKRLHH